MIQRRTMHRCNQRCNQRCTIRCDQWRCYLGRYHCRSMLLSVFDVVGRCIVCGSMGLSMHRLCYCPWRYMRDRMRDRCYRCVVICRGDTTMHATMNLDAENELGTWCNKQWQAIRSLQRSMHHLKQRSTLHDIVAINAAIVAIDESVCQCVSWCNGRCYCATDGERWGNGCNNCGWGIRWCNDADALKRPLKH